MTVVAGPPTEPHRVKTQMLASLKSQSLIVSSSRENDPTGTANGCLAFRPVSVAPSLDPRMHSGLPRPFISDMRREEFEKAASLLRMVN